MGVSMAIDPELLAILACPACRTPVALTADSAGLRCAECRRVYPIQDEIPVMLVDEATIEGAPADAADAADAAGPADSADPAAGAAPKP